eukprot:CAMPEP_0119263904 /NCGR_PEP_ID=MMETSP1329-20130426/3160_1 /TAXON_ID=114041 /ORGANISM="Genus nov. species nov., Strain RCC1024" /LENGTH=449 /DNA_ID=CAMNT_0007263643 /DNA_START=227 /DNA_END=1573 /DNA_ORIENTATION=+
MRLPLLVLPCAAGAYAPGPAGPRRRTRTRPRALDVEGIREEFPALQQTIHGEPLIYFDSGATSQKPRRVLAAMAAFYERDNANVHRGAHALATRATDAYEAAREKVARFVGGRRDEIVWTRGATEALNLVAHAWGDVHVRPGDEIVLTEAEHHSNLVPWQLLAKRTGCRVRYAKFDRASGRVDEAHLLSLVNEKTKLIAVAHVSNVLATVAPVAKIVEAARERGAPGCAVLLDGCQSAPHLRVDVNHLGVDFYVASSHKMCGPTGVGFLWSNKLEAMAPWQGGGEMIGDVFLDDGETTFAAPPARFEAGTPPIAEAVGLGEAVDFLEAVGMDAVAAHESALVERLYRGLEAFGDRLELQGPRDPRDRGAALVAFTARGVHPSDLAFFLDREGVATRAGHHCTQPLHARMGCPGGTVRASLSLYNTGAEVDAFLEKLDRVLGEFDDLDDF